MLLENLHGLLVGLVLGSQSILIMLLLISLHFRQTFLEVSLRCLRVGFCLILDLFQPLIGILQIGFEHIGFVSENQGANERAQQDAHQGSDNSGKIDNHTVLYCLKCPIDLMRQRYTKGFDSGRLLLIAAEKKTFGSINQPALSVGVITVY